MTIRAHWLGFNFNCYVIIIHIRYPREKRHRVLHVCDENPERKWRLPPIVSAVSLSLLLADPRPGILQPLSGFKLYYITTLRARTRCNINYYCYCRQKVVVVVVSITLRRTIPRVCFVWHRVYPRVICQIVDGETINKQYVRGESIRTPLRDTYPRKRDSQSLECTCK